METFKLILPEHLNHYGFLFGGHMLQWVDEAAYVAARLDFPHLEFVTVAMDEVEFRRRASLGLILRIHAERVHTGHTSVRYLMEVTASAPAESGLLFRTTVTLVSVDKQGNKHPVTGEPKPS
jgi:acyl-CoA hydrolase